MKQKVIDTILSNCLIEKGDNIVIGLSGGADSVCLALVLKQLQQEYSLTLKAVHINHLLRGEESTRDMLFCKDFCEKNDIDFVCYEIDVNSLAKANSMGIEEMARKVRYECFNKECSGGKIATAHNLDDVAETLIFNIARGSGIAGICSIPAKRDNIIRPLIDVSRAEIEEYLKENSQDFVTDSTNLSDEYSRNKIRHNVVPILKEINPAFLKSVKRLTQSAKRNTDFINSSVDELFKKTMSADELNALDEALLFEYIKKFLDNELGVSVDAYHINECVKVVKTGGRCQLPKGFVFENENKKLTVKSGEKISINSFEMPFNLKAETPYNKYDAKILSIEEFKMSKNVYNLFLKSAIDYDKISQDLIIRNRRPGDKIFLKNRKVNKLLKSVYNELKIQNDIRDKLAVITDKNKIVWAENVGVSADYAVNKNTKKILLISREVDYH